MLLSTIGAQSASAIYKQHKYWEYDPWLRQFSTWFTCRATNAGNSTKDVVKLESGVKLIVQLSSNPYGDNGLTSYSRGFAKSSAPAQLGQGTLITVRFHIY